MFLDQMENLVLEEAVFSKDIQALINFGQKLGINMNVLEGAWKTNLEVRPEKDWENLKGRAVSGGAD